MSTDLETHASRVLVPGFEGTRAPDWVRRALGAGLGAVVLFSRNVEDGPQVRALTDSLRAERDDILVAVDEEGGDVSRLEADTGSRYPSALALGHLDDVAATRAVGQSIGALVHSVGGDWNWAPVVEVQRGHGNPAIGVRSFGADPERVGRHAGAVVRGLQDDAGIAACAKHFPGHLDSATDPHLGLPRLALGADDLERLALAPFRACIAAGVRSVMTAHVVLPLVDDSLPVTLSHSAVRGLLREQLGFEGVIVSDALEMAGAAEGRGIATAAVQALTAGVDALCLGGALADAESVAHVHAAIVAAVRDGVLPEARLVEAAGRLAALAAWRGRARAAAAHPAVPDEEALRDLASRTLEAVGRAALGTGAPLVLECVAPALIAAGPTRERSIGAAVAEWRAGTTTERVATAERARHALARADGRPVVLVLREPQHHPWQREVEAWLAAGRRQAGDVVVEVGAPCPAPASALPRVLTRGSSRFTADAVVLLLADQSS